MNNSLSCLRPDIFYIELSQILSEMKHKEFDDFSFKAPQESEQSIEEIPLKDDAKHEQAKYTQSRQIRYRHLENTMPKTPTLFGTQINKKINDISQQLEQNIKRRLQLQKKLTLSKENQHKKQQNNSYKSPEEEAVAFNNMNRKADHIDKLIRQNKTLPQSKEKLIEKNKEVLLDFQEPVDKQKEQILIPIIQKLSSSNKSKPMPVYTVPDQIKIQSLLRKATFPQVPKGNLQQLRKQIQKLYAVHSPHSDIHYLLMVIYFHLQKFMKVRKNYEQIQHFKNFNVMAHWIAAQSEFYMENYDLCLQLTEECMNKVGQKYLPRFVYLKAKSYEEIGNYTNSIICFNQLIKIRPKISEYYLQRGIIYHRIGYYKQAKEDFVTFGILRPNAQQYIKEKVLCEKNQHRKRQYIALLAQMF